MAEQEAGAAGMGTEDPQATVSPEESATEADKPAKAGKRTTRRKKSTSGTTARKTRSAAASGATRKSTARKTTSARGGTTKRAAQDSQTADSSADSAKAKAARLKEELAETASEIAEEVKEKAEHISEEVKEKVEDLSEEAREALEKLRAEAREKGRRAKEETEDVLARVKRSSRELYERLGGSERIVPVLWRLGAWFVFGALAGVVLGLAFTVGLVQILVLLINGRPNPRLSDWLSWMGRYLDQILDYLKAEREARALPFPFGPAPEAEEDDAPERA